MDNEQRNAINKIISMLQAYIDSETDSESASEQTQSEEAPKKPATFPGRKR